MTDGRIKQSKRKQKIKSSVYPTFKRITDVILSFTLILLMYVPMLIISLTVKLTSKGKVVFKQVRVGKNGKLFVCYKFRTMAENAPKNIATSQFMCAENYITPIGKFLRKTSLDELPQLFNVLCGDMSIVGPRPLIPCERQVHKMRMKNNVYSVRPGITGLAQINGRDNLTDKEKVCFDTAYVENFSFSQDFFIVFHTFFKVFSGENVGISAKKHKIP